MRAAVHRRGVIQIQDVDTPAPKDGEVLVRVHAASVAAADYRIARILRSPIGRIVTAIKKKPVILGMEVAGTVHALGKNVNRFRIGDEVFGLTGMGLATHAEYVCVPEKTLEPKPVNMSLDESAAVLFGGITSLGFLRDANIQPGQRVLVYGASGSVGVFSVQLAKYYGAHVTGVCSTANVEMVRSLGADEVVDYTREDFSKAGRVYDVLIDTVGYAGFSRCLRSLKHGAPYIRIAPSGGHKLPRFFLSMLTDTIQGLWISIRGAAKMMGGVPNTQPGDYGFLKNLVEAGTLKTVIDRRYPLDRIAEAYRYADTGHKKGHVVIQMATLPAGPSPQRE